MSIVVSKTSWQSDANAQIALRAISKDLDTSIFEKLSDSVQIAICGGYGTIPSPGSVYNFGFSLC